MRHIYILLVVIGALAAFAACEDSLGIEKNVRRKYLDTNVIDKSKYPNENCIKATEILYDFTQTGTYKNGFYFKYDINAESSIKEAYIDTSNGIPYVWLELSFINTKVESYYMPINKYIKNAKFKLDSVQANGFLLFDKDSVDGMWSEVTIKDIQTQVLKIYHGEETNTWYRFSIDYPYIPGVIKGNFMQTIPEQNNDINKYLFNASFEIYY